MVLNVDQAYVKSWSLIKILFDFRISEFKKNQVNR